MSLRESFRLDEALRSLDTVQLAKVSGRLVRVSGMLLESLGCQRMTGQRCFVEQGDGSMLEAQVVGFNRDITYLMPFKKPVGLTAGSRVFPAPDDAKLHIDESWLGRVVVDYRECAYSALPEPVSNPVRGALVVNEHCPRVLV